MVLLDPLTGGNLGSFNNGGGSTRIGIINSMASVDYATDRVYFASEEGVVSVVAAKTEPEVLATNDMGEPCMASPAISDQTLFVRSAYKLWAIGQSASQ